MPKKKFLPTIFLSTVFLGSSFVQAQETITWPKSIQEAQANHPDLKSAEETVKQSEADKLSTVSDALLQVDLDAAATNSDGSTREYSYGASASQLIFDGMKTPQRILAAGETLSAARFSYMVTSSNIRLRLREAFVELLKQQQMVVLSRDIVTRRLDSLNQVKLRYEAGREHKGSLLTAEANLAQAGADVRQAERKVALAQRRLIKEIGRRTFNALSAEGTFDVADASHDAPDFEMLADTTPLLKKLASEKEAARHNVSSSKANYWPSVYADANIGRSGEHWSPRDESWSAGVRVTLPLFDGLDREASLKKAKSQWRQAQADELSGRDQIVLTLQEMWAGLQDAVDNVDVQKKYLESAEARAKISQAQYANGLTSFDDWIIIEDALVRTKKSFLDAQAQAALAEAAWLQAQGRTLDDEN